MTVALSFQSLVPIEIQERQEYTELRVWHGPYPLLNMRRGIALT
ncbi:MAG: hypothetical protein BWY14_01059 [Parcubacteria group bacterium ADurb.Bin192]|nr:MAG: hypothetical protein BWY14_01059 [Parcubacteria group bacterium ADurb.Bin192]